MNLQAVGAAWLGAGLVTLAQLPLAQPAAASPNNYADPATWLCRPGTDGASGGACAGDLSATALNPDGTRSPVAFGADPDAPIDCFYVYPTVSREPTPNADMTLARSETVVARNQFARFGAACRLYAPLYRQVTLAGMWGTAPERADHQLAAGATPGTMTSPTTMASAVSCWSATARAPSC